MYYRRLPVGQVVAFGLAADGKAVTVRVFVNAPYDKFVGADTRFWNASGFDVSLTANGLDVRTQSLVALLEGGVAFDTPPSGTVSAPAAASASYRLYPDRATAMKQDEGIATRYVLYFDESLRGLSVGAPVTFFGVPVGEVAAVGLSFTEKTLRVRPRVEIVVYPERMIANLPAAQEKLAGTMVKSAATRHAIMLRMVEQRGLRAQLTTGSLLTGQLYVALAYFPGAPKATFDANATPPVLPSVTSVLPDLEAKLSSIVAKLDRLPLDAIGDGLKQNLATLEQTLKDASRVLDNFDAQVVPALKSTLDDAKSALGSAERMLTSTENNLTGAGAPGQVELRSAMQEIARAARSLRILADYLEQHPEALLRGKPQGDPPSSRGAPPK